MGLPVHSGFTVEQWKQFGPTRQREIVSETRHHVYTSPFLYDNVRAGDFYEIDPAKGIEFKADTGYLTIQEEFAIAAVTVVGSGCYARGYNICEWWEQSESLEGMTNQRVKRQRVDGLNGIHPSIFFQLLLNTFPGLTYRDVDLELRNPIESLKAYSENYYETVHLRFSENTAHFRVGPPYPRAVTIRSGCLLPEVPGMKFQPRADYAVRVVDVTVIKKLAQS